MRTPRFFFCLLLPLLLCITVRAFTEDFAVFPDRKELRSPDGKYVMKSVDHNTRPGEFAGVFHSLILEEVATRRVRVLFDYLNRAAVAWSGEGYIIVTDYAGKRTSRVLVFAIDPDAGRFVMDKNDLARRLPGPLSDKLRENEHVFVEALRMQQRTLSLRVWGYGPHDYRGFRLLCDFEMETGKVDCRDASDLGKQSPLARDRNQRGGGGGWPSDSPRPAARYLRT